MDQNKNLAVGHTMATLGASASGNHGDVRQINCFMDLIDQHDSTFCEELVLKTSTPTSSNSINCSATSNDSPASVALIPDDEDDLRALCAFFYIDYDVVPYTQVNSAGESVVEDLCELHGMDYESLFGPFESECNSTTLGTNMATCVESSTTEFNIVTCVNAANPSDRCSMFPLKTNIFLNCLCCHLISALTLPPILLPIFKIVLLFFWQLP